MYGNAQKYGAKQSDSFAEGQVFIFCFPNCESVSRMIQVLVWDAGLHISLWCSTLQFQFWGRRRQGKCPLLL